MESLLPSGAISILNIVMNLYIKSVFAVVLWVYKNFDHDQTNNTLPHNHCGLEKSQPKKKNTIYP